MTKPGTSTDLLKTEIVLKNEENLERIKICLDQLNENQIWHRSNSHTNSIANLILHLNGNITQYILSSLGKEPDERQRAVEFSIEKGTNKEELILLISKCISKANQVIRETKEQRLLKEEIVQGSPAFSIGDYKRSYVMFRKLPEFSRQVNEIIRKFKNQ